MPRSRKPNRVLLIGIAASPGIARGTANHLVNHDFVVPDDRVGSGKEAAEIRRFRRCLREAREEVAGLRRRLDRPIDDTADQILASHQLILQDRELFREIVAAIKAERMNAAHAVRTVLAAKARYLESLPSELFRERAADIHDVERRILGRLLGEEPSPVGRMAAGSVIVADELGPADTIGLDPDRTVAFVTERGTLASHVTIVARSRGLPAVLGVVDAQVEIPEGAELIVDGDRGEVIVWPVESDRKRVEQAEARQARMVSLAGAVGHSPVTRDGVTIPVRANIERPEDAAMAAQAGADGIGLYRTEFFFMGATGFPDEESQRQAYAVVTETFPRAPVTIRTTDLGGDKVSHLMGVPREENAFLGLRGIRFCLRHPEIFRGQVRAILKGTTGGHPRILLPMISTLDELRAARGIINDCVRQLGEEGVPVPETVPTGIMIEVPSAVLVSEYLAEEADFFSIGSNDLIQYILAVDRGNPRVASLYDGFDPAVIRALDGAIWGGKQAGIPVGSCGELSSDLIGALLLVGLGVDELSVVPPMVSTIKTLLGQVGRSDLEPMAQACLAARDAAEVRETIREGLRPYPQFEIESRSGRLVCHWQVDQATKGGED